MKSSWLDFFWPNFKQKLPNVSMSRSLTKKKHYMTTPLYRSQRYCSRSLNRKLTILISAELPAVMSFGKRKQHRQKQSFEFINTFRRNKNEKTV